MKEYIVIEDHGKLICYTVLHLLLTIALMILSAYFYIQGMFLIVFMMVTVIWYSVKAMCRYGKKLWKKTPVCEFDSEGVILSSLPKASCFMKYKDIKEVKILKDAKSVKLFFAGDQVVHPSGWNYVGAVYLFQRNLLQEVEENVMQCLKKHHVAFHVVEQNRKRT